MTYRITIHQDAELDIKDAFEWYETRTLGLGSEFVRAVDACLSSVGRNPLAYSLIYKGVRRAFIRRFPDGVFYLFEQELIRVIACFHSKRNPRSWEKRI